jgi:hypothetical protein
MSKKFGYYHYVNCHCPLCFSDKIIPYPKTAVPFCNNCRNEIDIIDLLSLNEIYMMKNIKRTRLIDKILT